MKVLAIATRPDCLDSDVLELLDELNQIKPVWVELGLQTIHPESARYIRRGYPLEVFDTAVHETETPESDCYRTRHFISARRDSRNDA